MEIIRSNKGGSKLCYEGYVTFTYLEYIYWQAESKDIS